VQQQMMNIAQMFPGWLSPEQAIHAMQTGHAEELIESYNKDIGRANRMIQKLMQGP
jgi:hypothetical protein